MDDFYDEPLDDIDFDALRDMHRDHVRPSAAVETSPGNLQAWVTVAGGRKPIATRAYARELAIRYGGDMGATGNGQIIHPSHSFIPHSILVST